MAPRHVGLLAALAAVWGGSYLLIKYALEGFEPAVIVWLRCVLAGVVLYAVMRLRGGGAEARAAGAELRARPGRAILLGALAIALPFNLITFGELEVPSGLTAVLIAPASLFVAAFAPFIDVSEKVHSSALGGMFMGLAGVALLVGVESVHSLGEFLGSLAMIGAAACYALSSFVVKRYKGLTSVTTSFISIPVATVLTLPGAIATAPSELPGARALLSVAALGRGRDRAGLRDLLQADRRDGRGARVARVLPRARDRPLLRRAAARRADHRGVDRRARADPRRGRARLAQAEAARDVPVP